MGSQFVQTIGQGWANPLDRFMNENELLECMHMRTITKEGKRHAMSVPITQHATGADRERLEGKSKIAVKCSAVSDDVLAVIEEPTFFDNRKEEISARVFGTTSTNHPFI